MFFLFKTDSMPHKLSDIVIIPNMVSTDSPIIKGRGKVEYVLFGCRIIHRISFRYAQALYDSHSHPVWFLIIEGGVIQI